MGLGEHVIEDYAHLRLSLKAHPLSFLRTHLAHKGVIPARALWERPHGSRVAVCGLVLVRQRPGSAKGVVFATLEDETGVANIVLWPDRFERFRSVVMAARLLLARGEVQRVGQVIHVVVSGLTDLTSALGRLREEPVDPRTVDGALARADEVRREGRDLRDALPDGRNFR